MSKKLSQPQLEALLYYYRRQLFTYEERRAQPIHNTETQPIQRTLRVLVRRKLLRLNKELSGGDWVLSEEATSIAKEMFDRRMAQHARFMERLKRGDFSRK